MKTNEAKKAPKMHVKKNDTVVVISGKDKGKKGKVVGSFPAEGKVLVEGVNMITRHVKPRKTGQQGGRIKQEGAIMASKVMLYCPKCERPVRVKHVELPDGGKGRVCGRCQETLE
jgi:large subunit ribosomal protein L24